MTSTRKICVLTGSRAEYGLLRCIMESIKADSVLTLQIIATGMHLSPEFGLTYREIEKDGFRINHKVEMLLSSDTTLAMAKSTGIGLGGIAAALDDLSPDIVLVLGDRFEIFAGASAAYLLRIPIAHIHGGEVTEGAVDDALRHAISKLSQLHFTSTENYRKRVIQMGEQPDRVFCLGAPGIDAIEMLELMPREKLEKSIGFVLGERFLLVTFHPVTLGSNPSSEEMAELLAALTCLPKDVRILFTMPNADAGGRLLAQQIRKFVDDYPDRAAAFASLGHLRYLSAMKHCLAVVGNSSSSLIEAPSLGVGIVNIGDRQKGRIQAESVINCTPDRSEIAQAFARALSPEYQGAAAAVVNPYGKAGASKRIADVVANYPLADLQRKSFYDMSACSA